MSLTDQITIYATALAATLTLMRILSGITGSMPIRRALLQTTFSSALALFIAASAKSITFFPPIQHAIQKDYANFALYSKAILFISWLLAVFYYFGLSFLLRLYTRTIRFKDYGTFYNLRATPPSRLWRTIKRWLKRDKKEYEITIPERSEESLKLMTNFVKSKKKVITSHIITGHDIWHIRENVVLLCLDLINQGENVNYVCTNTSPSEIWEIFKNNAKSRNIKIDTITKQIAFIDAYTKVFGFQDDILIENNRKLSSSEMLLVVDCDSAASIHSGTAKAFKELKNRAVADRKKRQPCVMVYDTISSLAIPETDQEVGEFIIHLIAAETSYGMFSLFIECNAVDRDDIVIDIMKSCCGAPIDISKESYAK